MLLCLIGLRLSSKRRSSQPEICHIEITVTCFRLYFSICVYINSLWLPHLVAEMRSKSATFLGQMKTHLPAYLKVYQPRSQDSNWMCSGACGWEGCGQTGPKGWEQRFVWLLCVSDVRTRLGPHACSIFKHKRWNKKVFIRYPEWTCPTSGSIAWGAHKATGEIKSYLNLPIVWISAQMKEHQVLIR